jgi:hypothetical protein
MDQLRVAVNCVLDTACNHDLPQDQPSTNAFAIILASGLATGDEPAPLVLMAKPHPLSRDRVNAMTKASGVAYLLQEWQDPVSRTNIDVTVHGGTPQRLLLACECEANTSHGVGADFTERDWPTGIPTNDYAHDFQKLFQIEAPRLLFVARHKKSELEKLAMSLNTVALDHAAFWTSKRLDIVLLPAGRTERHFTLLGVGLNGAAIQFATL